MQYTLFSDGSCFNNGQPTSRGGWAFILLDAEGNTISEGTGQETPSTNNRAELKGVIDGLRVTQPGAEILVKTDSLYVINGFQRGWIEQWRADNYSTKLGRERKNRDLWEELYALVSTRNITWEWVKGHSGVFHNEYTDLRAKEARGQTYKPRRRRNHGTRK